MVTMVERVLHLVVGIGDRLTPKRDEVVLRTGPDFDDQGRELLRALARAGHSSTTWLVDGGSDPGPVGPVDARVLPARSLAGLRAYWRARVVVHTHGIYGSRRTSRRKRFVNIWHGMPIKRLEQGSDVGRNQTDLTVATAPIHAEHLAATWGLPLERVALTGLPRNDVLVSQAGSTPPAVLTDLTGGLPLVVWLPTYRAVVGDDAVDGVDTGTVSQFAGATPEAVNAAMARLGLHAILKSHPLAPRPEHTTMSNLEVWSEADLNASGLTLYHLLAHADYLISDHSSVWIDFLLLQRPMVFAMSDLDEYAGSRGFYFSSMEELLPGPIVTDLDGLERELRSVVDGDDRWATRRQAARDLHHLHQDDVSAGRVATLILDLVRTPDQ